MARRFASAILTCLVGAGASMLPACGDDGHQADGGHTDADFVVCQDTPAVEYMPGILVTSTSGAYVATLVSSTTETMPPVDSVEVGLDTWVVSVTDAVAGTPAD